LRALDYCPPVDITFGDYLRALVTSDRDAASEDGVGYRAALINAFRSRGIQPAGVLSYSEDSLSWDLYHGDSATASNPDFSKLWKDLNQYEDEPDRENEQQLYERLWGKADTFRSQLGLSLAFQVQARSINPLHRVHPDGSLQRQIVAELVQEQFSVPIVPGDPARGTFTFRGGTTLIINRQGEVRFSIWKPIDGPAGDVRRNRQCEYLNQIASSFPLAPYIAFDPERDLSFHGIHRGY
jgi:hypothetical protein